MAARVKRVERDGAEQLTTASFVDVCEVGCRLARRRLRPQVGRTCSSSLMFPNATSSSEMALNSANMPSSAEQPAHAVGQTVQLVLLRLDSLQRVAVADRIWKLPTCDPFESRRVRRATRPYSPSSSRARSRRPSARSSCNRTRTGSR
eukprot:7292711-Prymnesium_polylepis.1